MSLRTYGRKKPERTVAEVCMPGVPVKKSIVRPVKKEIRSKSHADISTGKSRISII
jgi:hypothetical protein